MTDALCSKYGCIPDYVPDNACQCNEPCEIYNDCCTDYVDTCVNNCIGNLCACYGCIADYVAENACQCNEACEQYNDCCTDYVSTCVNGDNGTLSDYAQNSLIYASIIITIIISLMIIILIQYIMIKRNENTKQTKQKSITSQSDDRIIIFCTFISITFYFICCLCYLISVIALSEDNINKKINAELSSILFWSFGFAFMQFVLASRLYFTFDNTPYKYSQTVFCLLMIIFVIATGSFIAFHIEYNSKDWDNPTLLACTVIGFICHIIFLFVVIFLYLRALFKIAINRSTSLLQDETKIQNDNNIQLMDHTTRMSVLTGIAGTVTIISFIIWCIFFAEEDEAQGGQGVSFEFLNIAWWLLPFDALINAICLFLNLPFIFSYNIYSKICYCCHGICGKICNLFALKMVKHNDIQKVTSIDSTGGDSPIGNMNTEVTELDTR
eukprot:482310_1